MEERIKKIVIAPGCIGCGLCAARLPEVFSVHNISQVKEPVDYVRYEENIKQVAVSCPVGVIEYE